MSAGKGKFGVNDNDGVNDKEFWINDGELVNEGVGAAMIGNELPMVI